MTRLHRAGSVQAWLAALLLVAACGASPSSEAPSTASPTPTVAPTAPPSSVGPSASPDASSDPAAIYDAIEDQVVAIRELEPVDVARETIDAATLKEMNAASFDEDNPPEYVAGTERLYKALALIPADASLRDTYLELLDSQALGFYRPDRKTLYVVSRSEQINGADKFTFAHEYDHALQDANFPGVLDDPESLLDQGDRALAVRSVFEGDATVLMTRWATVPGNLTPADFQDILALSTDPEMTAVLARTPAILVEDLNFPYTAGSAFITPIQAAGGWAAVDELFADLPQSTEQVLHPAKYAAGEIPVDVTVPVDQVLARLGDGWSELLQDTFGEFQTRIWLRESGVTAADAEDAAAGWGGDRLSVLSGPNDRWAVVMRSTWDSVADAVTFTDAAQMAIRGLPHPARIAAPGGKDVTVLIASDQDTLLALDQVLGATGV